MLPLCRIAEFSCLLNLLAIFNHFIPALYRIFTQQTLTPSLILIAHVCSLHAGSRFLSPRNTCARALNFQERRESPFNFVSVYPGTFTIHTNRQLYPISFPHLPSIDADRG